jgi:hypothetical protein
MQLLTWLDLKKRIADMAIADSLMFTASFNLSRVAVDEAKAKPPDRWPAPVHRPSLQSTHPLGPGRPRRKRQWSTSTSHDVLIFLRWQWGDDGSEDSCSYFPRMQYKSFSFLPLVAKLQVRPILAEIERSRSWIGRETKKTSYKLTKLSRRTAISSFCQYSFESLAHLLRSCSLPIPTQNIFSSTHHIKSFDACIEH